MKLSHNFPLHISCVQGTNKQSITPILKPQTNLIIHSTMTHLLWHPPVKITRIHHNNQRCIVDPMTSSHLHDSIWWCNYRALCIIHWPNPFNKLHNTKHHLNAVLRLSKSKTVGPSLCMSELDDLMSLWHDKARVNPHSQSYPPTCNIS